MQSIRQADQIDLIELQNNKITKHILEKCYYFFE